MAHESQAQLPARAKGVVDKGRGPFWRVVAVGFGEADAVIGEVVHDGAVHSVVMGWRAKLEKLPQTAWPGPNDSSVRRVKL